MRNVPACLALSILLGPVLTDEARAQLYGPDWQILTIGAAEFRPWLPADTYIDSDGYLYNSGEDVFVAPLFLPEGALLDRICLYANDSDPGGSVEVGFLAAKLVPGGQTPDQELVFTTASSDSNVGYGYYCSGFSFYTLRSKTNLDDDGILDSVAYYVYAVVPAPTQNALGLGGVEISWSRQVSPPPSAPTFGDVPASDPAFQYIEALVSSGITAGCGGGNYCPDARLTRRQMAVFLSNALGLHWAD